MTTYTKGQRQAMAFAFQRAADHISSYPDSTDSTFICWTLGRLLEDNAITGAMYRNCRRVILRRLDGFGTLEAWVRHKHPQLFDDSKDDHDLAHMGRNTRLAWLASLVAEFSTEE
jgi:hypothetical protein